MYEGFVGTLHVQEHGREQQLILLVGGVQAPQMAVVDVLSTLEVLHPGVDTDEHRGRLHISRVSARDGFQLFHRRPVLSTDDQHVGQAPAQFQVVRAQEAHVLEGFAGLAERSLTDQQAGVLHAHGVVGGALEQVGLEQADALSPVLESHGVARGTQQQLLLGVALQVVSRVRERQAGRGRILHPESL